MSIALLRKTEAACQLLAASASIAAGLESTVYHGQDNELKIAPAVICNCESATADFPDSCVYHVKTEIIVKDMAADSSLTSSLADTIYAAFENTASAINLTNTISGLTVYDVLSSEPRNSVAGDTWIQSVSYDIVCLLTT